MKFSKLFKYTNKKQIQEWQIFVKNNTFYTVEGISGGTLTTSLPTVCKGKNIGKTNETSDDQQAILEAKAKWQKKVDSGYNEVLTDEKKFFEPMLAFEYDKYPVDWNLVEEGKLKILIQPKLDGIRCIGENNTMMSRNGKPFVSVPHLVQNKVTLDGELYNHKFKDNFNKIVSLVKKSKPTKEDLLESEDLVEYWIYDFPNHKGTFSERYEALKKWHKTLSNGILENKYSFKIVPTYEIKSLEELTEKHKLFKELGYEGTIIRVDNHNYENKRSKQLLKFKDFQDDEFKIIGYEEGTGGRTGTIGKFLVELHDGATCESNVKGNFDFLRQVWRDRKKYLNTKATIKYFGYTPAGKLRFPYVIKLNREEYE